MTLDDYNAFCTSLPHATHAERWGGASLWKVGDKMFAVAFPDAAAPPDAVPVSFKVSPESFEMLKDAPGIRPAPYMASRGMIWLQWTGPETFDDEGLQDYIRNSHTLVAEGLPKKLRATLGL